MDPPEPTHAPAPDPDRSPADAEAVTPRAGGERGDRLWPALAGAAVLLAAALPWLWGLLLTPARWHFWGATWFAPDDGLLLSVVWEGARGHWLHHPPYATAHGPGALFYPGYLLLGHLARGTGLPPIVAFYLGRAAAGAILLATLHGFARRVFPQRHESRLAFLLAATGGGLEWVLPLLRPGWQLSANAPEAYPFFSMMASAHFPLAAAALLWILDALVPPERPAGAGGRGALHHARWIAGALFLASMQPFGSVVACCVGALWAARRAWAERRPPWATLGQLALLVALTVPFVAHQLVTIATDPAYAGWRTQVHTPAPAPWEAMVRIGLVLPFALAGMVAALRRRSREDLLLAGWTLALVALVALPYYQSRRFDLAAYVPFAFLAVGGLSRLGLARSPARRLALAGASAVGSLVLLAATLACVCRLDPARVMPRERWEAIRWLRDHAPERSVVLARPLTSLETMASTPLCVVTGHPTEIPDGEAMRRRVVAWFEDDRPLPDSLMARVRYVVADGPEARQRRLPLPAGYRRVFRAGDVSVYGRGP
jgi:hypothetical protein